MGAMAGPKLTLFAAPGGMSTGLNSPVDRPPPVDGPSGQTGAACRAPVRSVRQGGDR